MLRDTQRDEGRLKDSELQEASAQRPPSCGQPRSSSLIDPGNINNSHQLLVSLYHLIRHIKRPTPSSPSVNSKGLALWGSSSPLLRERSRRSASACEMTRSCYSCRVFVIREDLKSWDHGGNTRKAGGKGTACGGVPLSRSSLEPVSSNPLPLQNPSFA